MTKQYGVSVVGLTHSRGVGRVMPVDSRFSRYSKGSALIRKDEAGHSPIPELETEFIKLKKGGDMPTQQNNLWYIVGLLVILESVAYDYKAARYNEIDMVQFREVFE